LRVAEFSSCDVLGVPCVVGDLDTACTMIIEHALGGSGGYGVLCNVHVLMTARSTPPVLKALEGAWRIFPDGAPIAWWQRRCGATRASRVGGPDLMPLVFDRGRDHGLRHALFGSTLEVVDALRARLHERFPGVQIVAVEVPEPGEEDDLRPLDRLIESRPHLIWCALGAPKQELWMGRHESTLAPSLLLGVGAAFDFLAGKKARAPQWMQKSGLEWLHRLWSEPGRLYWRYASTNALFLMHALRPRRVHRTSTTPKNAEQ
jgi:N-acetylglucosaminyldiphosphoundecaprenol N-acetyl-beta-D-mannosaminyltransferase